MSPTLAYAMPREVAPHNRPMRCNRELLTHLLIQQWKRLTPERIANTRYAKDALADLIEEAYGIHRNLAENYLANLERSLPLHS